MSHIAIDARIIKSSTGRYIERLLHYLEIVDQENDYTILVRAKDVDYWKPTNPRFTVTVADFADYSFSEQMGFKQLLDSLSPDLVHFCMPQQPILYTGKHVTTIHDLTLLKTYNSDKNWLVFHAKQFVGRFVFKYVAKSSAHIIAISEYTKKDILDFVDIPADKITVTLEAADVIDTEPTPYAHPFKQFIMYVGSQSDYKNIKRLGDAHQALLSTHPNLGLILVGKVNDSAKINQTYFEKQGYKNILFTGFVSDEELAWLYSNTSAYIFPSLMEGFGLPGLEAMGYGAPVASSNATCLPEINGDAAIYFDPTSTEDMVEKINTLITDEALRKSLIQKGYAQFKKYSWERMAKQTHTIYMDALKK